MFQISSSPIETEKLKHKLSNFSAGALVTFEGWVRNHNHGRTVTKLEYEVCEELALIEAEKIFQEVRNTFDIIDIHSVHRSGILTIGEVAVWIGVLAAHRQDAFAACQFIIDQIKIRLPIWKKETYSDGIAEWVNCQQHNHDLKEEDLYARQILLPQIGVDGQAQLKKSKILIVGAGGLGSAVLLYLAGAGIGTLGICEFDQLTASNLHRQILYNSNDINSPKTLLARQRLLELNPFIKVQIHAESISNENANLLFSEYDLVLDCTDNLKTKMLLNHTAYLSGKPLIQASVHHFEGQLYILNPVSSQTNYHPGQYTGQCLRCLWPNIVDQFNAANNQPSIGVLGPVPGVLGSMQAIEAIKFILGLPTELNDYILLIDLNKTAITKIKCFRNPECTICSARSFSVTANNDKDVVLPTSQTSLMNV